MIDKTMFYKCFDPFENKYSPIFFFFTFGDSNQYCLVFDWTSRNPNGDFNPMMYAQLYDNRKSGSRKYITPDLIWDCKKEGTTTQYKLFRYLDKWVTDAISRYDEENI